MDCLGMIFETRHIRRYKINVLYATHPTTAIAGVKRRKFLLVNVLYVIP